MGREPDDDGRTAALGGAGDQADRQRGDQGARADVGCRQAQSATGNDRDPADLSHRPLDLPLRKLPAAADRRAADRDRGALRRLPRPHPWRRDGQRLRQGRAGDGATRPRGDRAAQGQHRGARSDNGASRPEGPRGAGAERRAARTSGLRPSPARAARRRTGSATSGSPSASPTLPERCLSWGARPARPRRESLRQAPDRRARRRPEARRADRWRDRRAPAAARRCASRARGRRGRGPR